MKAVPDRRPWRSLSLGEAKDIFDEGRVAGDGSGEAGVKALQQAVILPLLSDGESVCPFPWETETLSGVALGMYHCSFCGEMAMAGMPHPDYRGL